MNESDPIDALVARFPRLFRGQSPKVMSFLPAGWTEPVTRLFIDLDAMLDDRQAQSFEVRQIKEKLAGLRVYWRLGQEETTVLDIFGPEGAERLSFRPEQTSSLYDRISARVDQAEAEAATTCQRCGNGSASRRNVSGWLATLCSACAQARKSGKE